ncbi:MAG: patatin-like phospholipase family protein [Phycisphaerae bacterium]
MIGASVPDRSSPRPSDASQYLAPGADDRPVLATRALRESRSANNDIGLCLSGGGYRAALFHLGALRRLCEIGALAQVHTISSVSGGSILAARLAATAAHWRRQGATLAEWDQHVARPVAAFCARNIRTTAILLGWASQAIGQTSVGARLLAARYRALNAGRLADLPDEPRFVFCATDMRHGVGWTFRRDRIGSYRAAYRPPGETTVATATAVSSCFPPVFQPYQQAWMSGRRIWLTDGGVYDNLGLEPVWKDHGRLLVSNGGAPLGFAGTRCVFQRIQRYPNIMQSQAIALRTRWLMSAFELPAGAPGARRGAYWSVASRVATYLADCPHLAGGTTAGATRYPGYSATLVARRIARIRTDLNSFTPGEQAVLQNHGYMLAAVAIDAYAPELNPARLAVVPPFPEWMDEARADTALTGSDRRVSVWRALTGR